MGTAAIIALLTALAPLATDAVAYWMKAKATLSQSEELTPELEAALDAEIAKLKTNPEEYQKEQPL